MSRRRRRKRRGRSRRRRWRRRRRRRQGRGRRRRTKVKTKEKTKKKMKKKTNKKFVRHLFFCGSIWFFQLISRLISPKDASLATGPCVTSRNSLYFVNSVDSLKSQCFLHLIVATMEQKWSRYTTENVSKFRIGSFSCSIRGQIESGPCIPHK